MLVEPGYVFFGPQPARSNHFRIAYSSIADGRIDEGVAIIAATLDEMRGSRSETGAPP